VRARSIDPGTADLAGLIEQGVRLHGHLGPYLVAGIRMGLLALELLGSSGYFGLSATSDAGTETPLACLSDGIQIGSGCTTGKGNLRVTELRRPRATFRSDAGRYVTIELRPDAAAAFTSGDLETESAQVARAPREALFTWTIG